jgi:hypothetical protein
LLGVEFCNVWIKQAFQAETAIGAPPGLNPQARELQMEPISAALIESSGNKGVLFPLEESWIRELPASWVRPLH